MLLNIKTTNVRSMLVVVEKRPVRNHQLADIAVAVWLS